MGQARLHRYVPAKEGSPPEPWESEVSISVQTDGRRTGGDKKVLSGKRTGSIGPSAAFSVEPEEFTAVAACRNRSWGSLDQSTRELHGSERGNHVSGRSSYVAGAITAAEEITRPKVLSVGAGIGLPPKLPAEVVGAIATGVLPQAASLKPDRLTGLARIRVR
jgi:hypothetical protein